MARQPQVAVPLPAVLMRSVPFAPQPGGEAPEPLGGPVTATPCQARARLATVVTSRA